MIKVEKLVKFYKIPLTGGTAFTQYRQFSQTKSGLYSA